MVGIEWGALGARRRFAAASLTASWPVEQLPAGTHCHTILCVHV